MSVTTQSSRIARATETRPRTMRALTFLLAALPGCLAIWWVISYGVDVPTKDDWDIAPIVINACHGQLSWAELFAQQQEARTILPKLIFILAALAGHWEMRGLMLLSIVFCALTLAGIYFLLRRSGISRWVTAILLGAISAIVYSAAQAEVWVWASGFPSFMPVMFLVAALCVLQSGRPVRAKFVISLICAVASSFTLPHGLLLWGLTFPVLLIGGSISLWRNWLISWALACAVCAAVYFRGYVHPAYHPPFAPALPLLDYAHYFCMFLGGIFANVPLSLAARQPFALIIGAALSVIFATLMAYAFARRQDVVFLRRARPWFALGGYSLGAAFLAALGRIGFGLPFAISSRYVTFSLYLLVAVLVLTWIVLRDLRTKYPRFAPRSILALGALGVAGVLTVFLGLANKRGVRVMEVTNADTRLLRSAIVFSAVLDTSSSIIHAANPDAERIRQSAPTLVDLNLLRPPLVQDAAIAPLLASPDDRAGGGEIERIETVDAGFAVASGTAFLGRRDRAADGVLLGYEDAQRGWVAFALSDDVIDRHDLRERLHSREAPLIGWRARFPRKSVPPGAKISAWAVDAARLRLYPLESKGDKS